MEDQPQVVNFEGATHSFPADFTQTDISKALRQFHDSKNVPGSEKTGLPAAGAKPPAPEEMQPQAEGYQNLRDWLTGKGGLINQGINKIVGGVEHMAQPGLDTKLEGGSGVLEGVGKVGTPALIAASLPLAASSPLALAGGIAGGAAGGKVLSESGKAAVKALGGSKALQDFTGDAGDLVGGIGGGIAGSGSAESATNLVKALRGKGNQALPPDLEEFAKLKPTLSQWIDKLNGKGQTATKVAEDFLTPGAKAKNILESGRIATEEAKGISSGIAGRAPSVVSDPNEMSLKIQNKAQATLDSYDAASQQAGAMARLVAEGAPQPRLDGTIVKGATPLTNTLGVAKGISDRYDALELKPTDGESLSSVNEAKNLLKATNAKFDETTGDLISSDPVSFGQAWDKKQAYGNNTSFGQGTNSLNQSKKDYKSLFNSMNQDIDAGIPGWDTPDGKAMKAWHDSKALAGERNAIFDPDGTKHVQSLQDFVKTIDTPSPTLNSYLENPQALQRIVNAKSVTIAGQKIPSSSPKDDLAAALFQKLWDANVTRDPKGGISVNAKSLYDTWNDPRYYQAKKILFSNQDKAAIDELIKNTSLTQTQGGFGAPRVWMTRAGLSLPFMLATTGGLEHAAATATIEIGASALVRAITKPSAAEGLVRLAKGQALGMSDTAFARRLGKAVAGSLVWAVGKDGTRTPGTLDKDGQFTPKEQP